jgi:integrase
MMGVVKNRHGTYNAQQKVPPPLQEAVASLLGNSKSRQKWLKKSLGTKDQREAHIRAKPVLMGFDRLLADAAALMKQRPLRTTLAQAEIDRIAEYHFATTLSWDEEERREGTGNEEGVASVAQQLTEAGVEFDMPLPLSSRPAYGLSDREVAKRNAEVGWLLPIMQNALARGDISKVSEYLQELLAVFQINLDPKCEAYRKLGMAVLKADVEALQVIARRSQGEPIATPKVPSPETPSEATGETLRAAFQGWKRERRPSPRTLTEYERAISLFVDLHGDLPVVQIKRSHARTFRDALQQVPRLRTAQLSQMTLPQLVEWSKEHPEVKRVTATTVNKQIGGVQAMLRWAYDKGGFIPDDVSWSDPFTRMRLEEDESDRAPYDTAGLQKLFRSPVFTQGARPKAARGETAYWFPLLALFAGCRRSEIAGLTVADVQEIGGHTMLTFVADREARKSLKTRNSQRSVPLHPMLKRLGFLDYVEGRRADGERAWLFPLVAPDKPGELEAWTKWFSRYRRSLGITDANVFHSLRHNFLDALRAAGVDEEMRTALFGHGWHRTSTTRGYGAKDMVLRFTANALAQSVAAVKYSGLDLSHLLPPNQRRAERQEVRGHGAQDALRLRQGVAKKARRGVSGTT